MWKKTLIVALCLGGCGGSSSEPDDIATGADGGFTPDVAAGADQASDPSAGDAISSTGGGKICGGARDADGRYWGVDLDNSEDCSGCCYICGATAETPTLNLLCN